MSEPVPGAVVFDLGGVLVDWNPRHLYGKLIEDETAMERFLAEVCTGAWNLEQDRGRPFAEGVAVLEAAHPEKGDLIRAYFERWPEMLGGPIDGSVAILEELASAGVPLFALSNWSAETFPHAIERYPFFSRFKAMVVSGHERIVKPDPRIFRLLLDREGLEAGTTVFIDDVAHNVMGARAVGLDAILFESPAQLRDALAERGLPVMRAGR